MSIVAADILFKLSTTAGSAGNTTAQADPNQSLGKYISTTQINSGATHNLFDRISAAENAASTIDYRCVFIHNSNATNTLLNAFVWNANDVAGGATVALGVDTTAASPVGSSSAQALTIANETTIPSGVTFSAAASSGAALALGDIPAGYVKAVWVRRTATNSSALSGDGFDLRVDGETT